MEKVGARKEKQNITHSGKGKRKIQALSCGNMLAHYSKHVYRYHFLSISFITHGLCFIDLF